MTSLEKLFRKRAENRSYRGSERAVRPSTQNSVHFCSKSARIGRDCRVIRSDWIEAAINRIQTGRVRYHREEYQRSGDKEQKRGIGVLPCSRSAERRGKRRKREEPGLSEKWPSAFHECPVYIKGYGAAKKRDGNCKKGNGECLVMGGYPIPDCSARHRNSAMITRCSKIFSLSLGRLWQTHRWCFP